MLRRLGDRLEFAKSLGFRLGALLSVAILPIGMISLIQNLNLQREAQRSAEIALLGRTASAAAGERALLQGALGSADALGPAVLEVMGNPQACSDLMRHFAERSAIYSGAAFVPTDGMSTCHSGPTAPAVLDVTPSSGYRHFIETPETQISLIGRGRITDETVISVIKPLFRETEMLGYIGVSLTQALLRSTHESSVATSGARIVTFNSRGDILATDLEGNGDPHAYLPRGFALDELLALNETTFRDYSNSGEMRVFSVVPVVPDQVYALGSWNPQIAGIAGLHLSRFGAFIIPIALWLVSLAVAYFAVYRLVLRHIRELRSQMRRFAIGDRSAPPPVLEDAPTEIADVSQTFHNMARILIRDEEAMEAAVTEKTVLLKEVHHRVKNNLQLIASIINMQSRMIDDPDAKRVLRSVQDRVAALATIYRNLYQAEHLDAIAANRLIGDIINQMANAALGPGNNVRIDTRIAALTLLPDQAVPLSLLATEAFTNALKYAGISPGEDRAWIRVTLEQTGTEKAVLEVVNSIGHSVEDAEGTGLGSQLIEAFSTQLEGEAFSGVEGNTYVLRLPFRIEHVATDGPEDRRNVVLTSAARDGAKH